MSANAFLAMKISFINAMADGRDAAAVAGVCDPRADADIVLHLTEWPAYRKIDPAGLYGVVRQTCLVDPRNALDLDR